jgi:signal transduction histidine kinase
MRSLTEKTLADCITITFRWLIVVGVLFTLSPDKISSLPLIIIMVLYSVVNVTLSIIAILNLHLKFQYYLLAGIDFVIVFLIFGFSGGIDGTGTWIGMMPVLTAVFGFRFISVLIIAICFSILQVVHAWFYSTRLDILSPAVLLTMTNLSSACLFYWIRKKQVGQLVNRQSQRPSENMVKKENGQPDERERIRAFYELTNLLSTTLNYQRVLDIALDLSVNALSSKGSSAERMVSAVLLFSEDQLHIGCARRLTPSDMKIVLVGKKGVVEEVIREGEPRLLETPSQDPELGRIVAFRSCNTVYCVPLRSGLDVYGLLIFGHVEKNFFTPERCDILEIISRQAIVAIQNARLYQDLKAEKEHIVEVQDEAQKKLARDLHDGPTQSLAALAMRVNYARRLLEKDPKSVAEELYKIEDLARRTTKEMRHMLFTLRPLVLESQGLIAALESMAEKMRETFDQNVIVEADAGIVDQLESNKQTVVFYLVEEAVNNARKHAQAAHIWVRLRAISDNIAALEIIDNGVGFDIAAVNSSYENRGSLGMVNLRERTELLNGILDIDSVIGKGTRIRVFIPLTEEAVDRLHHR